MNIQSAKRAIVAETGIILDTLMLVRQMDQEKPEQPTAWLSHWDNKHRVRITMHEDIMKVLKDDPGFDKLALKDEVVPANGDRAAYRRFIVIKPNHVELAI